MNINQLLNFTGFVVNWFIFNRASKISICKNLISLYIPNENIVCLISNVLWKHKLFNLN